MPMEVFGFDVKRKCVREQQVQRCRDVARCVRTEICRGVQSGGAAAFWVISFHRFHSFRLNRSDGLCDSVMERLLNFLSGSFLMAPGPLAQCLCSYVKQRNNENPED